MAEIITLQLELHKQIEKTLINFKKSPKSRLTENYTKVKIEVLDKLWTSFIQNHMELIKMHGSHIKDTDYEKQDIYTKTEETYTLAKCEMMDITKNVSDAEFYDSQLIQMPPTIQPEIKLPRINIPTFSGKYSEWVPFHDLFLSLIHNNKVLMNVQKLHYLKSSLSGEAECLLRHIPIAEANYNDAWSTLKKRYNNKRFIVASILKRLMSQKSFSTESSQAVKALLDTTNECISGLNNLGIKTENWDVILIHITVSKLDTESIRLWEQQISQDESGEELPAFKQLCEFLESRFRTLEILDSTKSAPRSVTKQNSYHVALNVNCKFCRGNHYIYNCKEFAHLTYTDRQSFVERNGLCFNCLIPNHTVNKCRQRTSCRRCGRKHHSLIHPENRTTEQASSSNGDSQPRDELQSAIANTSVNCNVAALFNNDELINNVLLATAIVKVQTQNGTTCFLRALIDSGSQGSFITESASQFLGLKKIPINCTITRLNDKERCLASKHMVIFNAQSRYEPNFNVSVKAYILKSLTRLLPDNQINDENWSHLHELNLADPSYNTPGNIDLLLGADIHSEILKKGLRKGPRGTPIAQSTHLGWIISGQLPNIETRQSYTITINMHAHIDENIVLQKFWELESEETYCKKILTEEEKHCEQIYANTYRRDDEGRYIVALPFKEDDPSCQYGSSRQVAERRLLQLERRLGHDQMLKKEYAAVLKEYLDLNHMEPIIDEQDRHKPTAVYLPHHAVVRNDKTTTKVRVVFDASCKYKNGVSLNDNLMVGPRLQQDLRHIIMRWRVHQVCLVADIVKMYRQVIVDNVSADFQRILWRDDPTEEIRDYRNTRVTFGTASAPYLATKTLQQLAIDEKDNYPLAAKITLTDFYMDDLLTGGDTFQIGAQIFNEMTGLLKSGGFQLQKWNSNDPKLLHYMQVKDTGITTVALNLDSTIKTLGIAWHNMKDQFQYSISLPENNQPITKRLIASDVSKLFDPMGWLAPTIIIGKVFLQRLWLAGVTWDQKVPNEIEIDWLRYRTELPYLSEITIKRWLHTTSNCSKLELYGFSDASTMAYAAAVYARVIDAEEIIHVHLISAKTKVAPVKTVSVPRLELCGAVLLTRLLNEIAEHLNVNKDNVYAYTDSKVVLSWIQSHPSKWKTFIANRTSEIITSLPSRHWNYVASKENPADLASRGVQASMLKDEQLWWNGPRWLQDQHINHQISTDIPIELSERKSIKVLYTNTKQEDNFTQNLFTKYSNLNKLLRIISRCKRFKHTIQRHPQYITTEEMENAMTTCIILCQSEEFSEEISCLKEMRSVKKQSKLRSLNPLLDEKGILRVGGRLRHADIPEDAKHQIILPYNNSFSKLVVAQAHIKTLHGGPMLMMNYLRQRYWIVGGKSMINQEVHKCVVCIRQRASTRTQLMADLPKQRVTPTRPFLHAGVDFAGPFDIRVSKGRGCKTYKGYISIFICMVTRAIHIEIVSSLESADFIAAFKRFTARRGHCSHIWSDNGTNFIAGNKLLKEMYRGQLSTVASDIQGMLAQDGTTWHNIPAAAPHFGGLWEAGVRSIKYHLRRILGNSTLTYEEMSTATAQIEACLNSRPISPISDDIDDFLPLTPGHFLIGESPIIVPEKSYLDTSVNRLSRWHHVQRMVQHFWDRWSKEYLSRLQQRPKWMKKTNNEIKIGDLVLIKDDHLPPGKWSLARILDSHPGRDNLIRVVTLKCRNAIVKRPITKICPLLSDL